MAKKVIVDYALMRQICTHLEKNRRHFRGKLDIGDNEKSSEKSNSAKQVKRLLLSAKRKKKEESKRKRKKLEREEPEERFRQGQLSCENESDGDSDGESSDSSASSGSFKTDSDSDEHVSDSGDESTGKTGEAVH